MLMVVWMSLFSLVHLLCLVSSYFQAILGGMIRVPTLTGEVVVKVCLYLPPFKVNKYKKEHSLATRFHILFFRVPSLS